MANDLEFSRASAGVQGDTLTEEAYMATLHAQALAAYVDAEMEGEAKFPSQVEGETYEIIVRKMPGSPQADLFA
jgi:hypothetical protein